MTDRTIETPLAPSEAPRASAYARLEPVWRPALPIVIALTLGAGILAALGRDPIAFYAQVVRRAILSPGGLQETLILMAPLLLIAASLIVSFRAGLWNLGVDGQFLLAAVFVAAYAPGWVERMPYWLAIGLLVLLGAAIGAIWSIIPALLRAYQGVNEIISTLMMTFLAMSTSALLVKTVFDDPDTAVPQTLVLAVALRLPRIADSLVHIGVPFAVIAILVVHFVMTRTAFGTRMEIVGHNAAAAHHFGLNVPRMTVAVLALSSALAGLAGAIEILGVRGVVRADWHPSYGLMVVPLVFLARFHGVASVVFVAFFAVLLIGGESASRRADLPNHFLLIMVALILLILAVVERMAARRTIS